MATTEQFIQTIQQGYTFKGENVKIGVGMLDGKAVSDANVYLPFKTMNRHGLIAGATGTGKTKTLQVITECLSDNSIPVLVMDIKGDFSGIAQAGTINNKITERYALLKETYTPTAFPVEFLTLSDEKGVRLRATVTEFGPILLSKILGLNDTQGGIVSIIFKYCDDNKLPLLDLKDFIKVLQYAGDEGKESLEKDYGKIASTSLGTILRKVIELQQQGADIFFGEKSFEVEDLMRINNEGKGMVNILRVTDMQNRPKLFSTFMLQLLAELYTVCPEEGDLDKPKLILFIDEAHLIFQEASSALMQQIETVIKLIRSKGIGIFFCTQNPQDIPASVLAQLGLKIQHALRAFTAADRKVIKTAAENFPETEFYTTDELLTQLGIGEAFITLLNEKGIPTPLVHTLLCSPRSRMDVLTETEIDNLIANSKLVKKYSETIDSQSAYEILNAKIEDAVNRTKEEQEQKEAAKEEEEENKKSTKKEKEEPGFFDNPTVKQIGRTAASVITRSLLGALGISSTRRVKRKSLW
jgi:DNA helicase HerA-like ATPase